MPHPRTTSRSVIARFLSRGPLERLPKRGDDRDAVLRLIASTVLPEGTGNDEPGLNLALRRFSEDTAMLRRALVDDGLVLRAPDGSRYDGVVPRSALVVRPATQEDEAEVNRLTVAAYLGAGYFEDARSGYMLQIQDAAGRRAATDVWVAERDRHVLAAVTLAEAGNEWADVARQGELEFRLLVVEPLAQRTGVAAAVVEAIEEEATRRGLGRVVLTTNAAWEAPNALYPRLGYVREAQRDWIPRDAPHVLLRVYAKQL